MRTWLSQLTSSSNLMSKWLSLQSTPQHSLARTFLTANNNFHIIFDTLMQSASNSLIHSVDFPHFTLLCFKGSYISGIGPMRRSSMAAVFFAGFRAH